MSEASSIANGSAHWTRLRAANANISTRTPISNPLPTMSSTYFHKNCINTMNRHMANVIRSSGMKVFRI